MSECSMAEARGNPRQDVFLTGKPNGAKWLSRQHFDDSWNVRFSAALLLEACTRNVTCLRIGYVEVELISKCYITAFPIATSRNSSERMWIYDVLLVKGFECILSLRLFAFISLAKCRCGTWCRE